jgi:hypothetical protein
MGLPALLGSLAARPNRSVSRLLVTTLSMIAEFQGRTRDPGGDDRSLGQGPIRRRQHRLKPGWEAPSRTTTSAGTRSASWRSCSGSPRSTVYRAIQRAGTTVSDATCLT